jgi:serine/threonine protein kinase
MTESAEPRAPDPAALCGRIVDGRYLLERIVGSGGFGVVYRATHLRFDSPIAIKVLRLRRHHDTAERRRFLERFVAEGKMLFNLGALHPSIVRVFEAGTVECADGSAAPYLAMEWLEGVPLDREIERRRELGQASMGLEEMVDLLDPAAQALAVAHRSKIAHRDIKPGNIFLCRQNERITSKLVDFGLAKAVDESATTTSMFAETGGQDVSFTPSYGSPEQWLRRLGATGPWTDVHALALVCAELLSGKRAFQGDSAQLMAACLDQAFRPTPRALNAEVSDAVEAVFLKALALEPRQRFGDAASFWRALRAAAGIPDQERRPSRALLAGPASPSNTDTTAPTDASLRYPAALDVSQAAVAVPASRRTRSQLVRLASLLGFVAFCLVSLWMLSTSETPPPQAAKAAEPAAESRAAPRRSPPVVESGPAPVPTPSPLAAGATSTRDAKRRAKPPRLVRGSAPETPTVSPASETRPPAASASNAPIPEPARTSTPSAKAAFSDDDLLHRHELTRRR